MRAMQWVAGPHEDQKLRSGGDPSDQQPVTSPGAGSVKKALFVRNDCSVSVFSKFINVAISLKRNRPVPKSAPCPLKLTPPAVRLNGDAVGLVRVRRLGKGGSGA
jgi:hypothetical protein